MKIVSRRSLLGGVAALGLTGFSTAIFGDVTSKNPLAGKWTYRSFINNPDSKVPFNDLEFAIAEITIDESPFGTLAGKLSFGDDYLKLNGTITYGNPFSLRFRGVGATPGTIENGQPWIYNYQGYVAPAWPDGVDQVPAIVGTIVRTVSHSGGKAKAGLVASFIAVRKS
jgi:hypothetical protein